MPLTSDDRLVVRSAKQPCQQKASNCGDTDSYGRALTHGFAGAIAQFLDRDTSPDFASGVAGPRIADFLADPSAIDSILEDMQAQAEVLLGGE